MFHHQTTSALHILSQKSAAEVKRLSLCKKETVSVTLMGLNNRVRLENGFEICQRFCSLCGEALTGHFAHVHWRARSALHVPAASTCLHLSSPTGLLHNTHATELPLSLHSSEQQDELCFIICCYFPSHHKGQNLETTSNETRGEAAYLTSMRTIHCREVDRVS